MMNNYLNTTTQNVGWFVAVHGNNELEIRPAFQRKPVWVTRQKSYLIDTILNGYPIPEIYMQESVDENGVSKHVVVDGQQRIRAILDFVKGAFVMDPKDSPNFADLSFDDLTSEQKKAIFQYKFIVRTLPEMPDAELREVFRRINTNVVSLNAQELRQATYWGPFITTMNNLSDDSRWGAISLFTPNDIRRMLDVEYISELSVALLHGVQNKKSTLDKYYQLYEEEFEDQELLVDTFDLVLGEITRIMPDIRKTRWSKKSDFYTLFLSFAAHIGSLPLSSNKRKLAASILDSFGNQIDQIGKEQVSTVKKKFSKNVQEYSRGVIRAASDLNSRKLRAAALDSTLANVWMS